MERAYWPIWQSLHPQTGQETVGLSPGWN